MIIIGVDYHPSFQQIAFVDKETGECNERQLNHSEGEAEKFYRDLKLRGVNVRVGMEATGHARWFERLCVWVAVVCSVFSLAGRLPSAPSASGFPLLFRHFVSTARPSDFPSTYMLDFWIMSFSNRPYTTA
jgi:hypothetical protein